jgi:hypothetical protein
MGKFKDFYKNFLSESLETVLEMPQHYPGDIHYQAEGKFVPISKNNVKSYIFLGSDGDYTFYLHPSKENGYVFRNDNLEDSGNDVQPSMIVSLRDTPFGFKQAHKLRIKEKDSRRNITTTWYLLYAQREGGVVSDFEHLEGGKTLWRSLVNNAESRGFKVFLLKNSEKLPISKETPDSEIWNTDPSGRQTLIMLER